MCVVICFRFALLIFAIFRFALTFFAFIIYTESYCTDHEKKIR